MKAIITAVLELPTSRMELAGSLNQIGVRTPAHIIPCSDEEEDYIKVKFFGESDFENELTALATPKDSLGSVNTTLDLYRELPQTQKEKLKAELSQNPPDSLSSLCRKVMDFQPKYVTEDYYFPLTVSVYEYNEYGDLDYDSDCELGYCVIKCFFANIKRGGILLTQIAVGSLHMFSLPRGYSEGFTGWCKQIIAICFTAFMQTTLLLLGMITMQTHALLGLGVMLAANEVPRIAQQFGLDTSISNFSRNGLQTKSQGEIVYFLVQPTNISVLSEQSVAIKIQHLMQLLSVQPDIEIICSDARENFEYNKLSLARRAEKETNLKVQLLLRKDMKFLDDIQLQMSTAREFMFAYRVKNANDQSFATLNRLEKQINDQGFDCRRATKDDIKRILSRYFGHMTEDAIDDVDGERMIKKWIIPD